MHLTHSKELTKTSHCVKAPKMYCCVIYNDNVTTMDFVVAAICQVFKKSSLEATQIMMYIHNTGKAKVGRYCYDIAMTKKQEMDSLAKEAGYPLKTTVETAEP